MVFMQRIIGFKTNAKMRGDSKTQDGINCHVGIIDEYHAHKDDTVRKFRIINRAAHPALIYHITTAGANVQSACKRYEESVIEVLEGRNIDNSLWIMIHDIDQEDLATEQSWENGKKANPLLGTGNRCHRKEFVKALNQPSKIRNFKTKNLNMWVDQEFDWIYNEIWMKGKVDVIPWDKFTKLRLCRIRPFNNY
jgi:phage terminase large subunit-like protein